MKVYLKLLYLIFYFSSVKISSAITNHCYVNINKKSLKNFLLKYTKNILLSIGFGVSIFGMLYHSKKENKIFKGIFISAIYGYFWIQYLKQGNNKKIKNQKNFDLVSDPSILELLNKLNYDENEEKLTQNLVEIEENKAFLKLLKIIAC